MKGCQSSRLTSQGSEPRIIVVEQENEGDLSSSQQSINDDSLTINPYLLSPYSKELRKHSLPTPQCSGITASQVRRLSERGEGGPGPKQAEFLATLSSAPLPQPGGRRHSVVTISKLPQTIFGRSRRESVAVPSNTTSFRVLPNRRESIACPVSNESRGSVHNLQLDIMDDIVQARKVRMKVWNTSKEKLCEVEPIDEAGNVERYANSSRRFSDLIGTRPPTISSTKRRASELQPLSDSTDIVLSSCSTISSKQISGIVCSNTDLNSILCSLSTSAMEIDQLEKKTTTITPKTNAKTERIGQFKSRRSNSFDISVLQPTPSERVLNLNELKVTNSPSQWFIKRHQPISKNINNKSNNKITTVKNKVVEKEPGKVIWDEKSGSLVDACALGSAIEGFLRQSSPDQIKSNETNKIQKSCLKFVASKQFTEQLNLEQDPASTCDTSLCSTIKDLFVK